MNVFEQIVSYCYRQPEKVALEVHSKREEKRCAITYRQMLHGISHVDSLLSAIDNKRGDVKYGLVMNNSPEWVVCDLALGLTNRIEIPVPTIFSAEQAKNLLRDVDFCIVDDFGYALMEKWERAWNRTIPIKKIRIARDGLYVPSDNTMSGSVATTNDEELDRDRARTCKIIHTSGTTNAPKGVKISRFALGQQVTSLRSRIGDRVFHRYLSIVPLSLLIEQIIAIYLFMSYGGKLTFLEPEVSLLGSSDVHPRQFLEYFSQVRPDFIVISPSIVSTFYAFAKDNEDDSAAALNGKLFGASEAPFIACGNAPISPEILIYLHQRGIPIMEGYGLSENTSVVSWNSMAEHRFGTVGKPLEHVQVKLSDSSELLVKSSSMFQGYTTDDPSSCRIDEEGWLHTGDVAEIDVDGYVKIKGRIKHIVITADGRNISPEWVESHYKRLPFVRNVVVYGEGLPKLVGVIVVDGLSGNEETLRRDIDAFGRNQCSDIERIYNYVLVEGDEHLYKEYFTITGDPVRRKLWDLYQQQVASQRPRHVEEGLSYGAVS